MDLPVLALLASEVHNELPIPAVWYGVIFFAILMLSLLVTLAFAHKGRELPAEAHSEQ